MRVTPVAYKLEQSIMGQKMCFNDSYTSLLGCEEKLLIICTIFTKNAKFPQCKTSIDNNSGSIKDRVVKFAYSMGFSAIADRTV